MPRRHELEARPGYPRARPPKRRFRNDSLPRISIRRASSASSSSSRTTHRVILCERTQRGGTKPAGSTQLAAASPIRLPPRRRHAATLAYIPPHAWVRPWTSAGAAISEMRTLGWGRALSLIDPPYAPHQTRQRSFIIIIFIILILILIISPILQSRPALLAKPQTQTHSRTPAEVAGVREWVPARWPDRESTHTHIRALAAEGGRRTADSAEQVWRRATCGRHDGQIDM